MAKPIKVPHRASDVSYNRDYAPIASFYEDLEKELERPLSMQNLDKFIEKLKLVENELKRADSGFEKLKKSGGDTSKQTSYLSQIQKEAQNALKAQKLLDKAIMDFEGTSSQNQERLKGQGDKLKSMREQTETIRTHANDSVERYNKRPETPKQSVIEQYAAEQKKKREEALALYDNPEVKKRNLNDDSVLEAYNHYPLMTEQQVRMIGHDGHGEDKTKQHYAVLETSKAELADFSASVQSLIENFSRGLEDTSYIIGDLKEELRASLQNNKLSQNFAKNGGVAYDRSGNEASLEQLKKEQEELEAKLKILSDFKRENSKQIAIKTELDENDLSTTKEKLENLGNAIKPSFDIGKTILDLKSQVEEATKAYNEAILARQAFESRTDSNAGIVELATNYQKALDDFKKAKEEYDKARDMAPGGNVSISDVKKKNDAQNRMLEAQKAFYAGGGYDALNSREDAYKRAQENEKEKQADLKLAQKDYEEAVANSGKPEYLSSYSELVEKLNEAKARAQELAVIMQSGGDEGYSDAREELTLLVKEIKTLESEKKRIDTNASNNEPTIQSYQELEEKIASVQQAKEELAKGLADGSVTDFQSGLAQLKQYEVELKNLEKARATVSKNNPEEKSQMSIIGLLKETLSIKARLAGQRTALPFSTDTEGAQANIQALSSRMKELDKVWNSMKVGPLIQAFSTVGSAAKGLVSKLAPAVWNGLKSGIQSLASGIQSLASGGFNLLKKSITSTISTMQKLVSGGFNAVKRGISTFRSGLQTLTKHMSALRKKHTPNLVKTLQSFKGMLMRRIKRSFISDIFNEAKAGLVGVAKYSQEFNQNMSNLKNSMSQVAGNVAVSMSNIINAIAPVLETIIGWVNSAVIAFNQLWAALTGKSTIAVAKKKTDSYASSLDKASGSAKELNNELYGFDEITKQQDPDKGSGGGGGGSGTSPTSYEKQEVESIFSDMAEMLKNGQFFEVGQLIGNALDGIVIKIDDWFKEVRPKTAQWARNIAQLLNGIVDTNLFADMGTMVGDGLNLVFDVLWSFLDEFDFENLGRKFADGINHIFTAIDWDLLGKTFAEMFNSIWDFLGNTFATLDWQGIGYSLSSGLSSFFANLDWKAYKGMVLGGINGVIEMLYTFIDGVDWDNITKQFVANVEGIINGIDWDNLEGMVSKSIQILIDAFETINNSTFFSDLATHLGETVGGILKDINWLQLAVNIVKGILNLRDAFWTFVSLLDPEALAQKIADAINGLFDNSNVQNAFTDSNTKATEGIKKIIKAFGKLVDPDEGINFAEIGTQIGTHVTELFQGINWEELATNIGLGVSGIVEAFGNLLTGLDLPNVAIKIANGVNALFDPQQGGAKFDDAISAVSKGVNGLIEGFANLIDPENGINFAAITSTISDKVNHLIQATDWATLLSTIVGLKVDLYNSLFQAIGEVDWETLGSKIGDAVNNLFTEERLASLGKNIGKALTGVLEGITSLISGIDWEKVGEGIITFIKNIDWGAVLTSILELLMAAVSGAGSLITGLFNAIFGGGGGENIEVPQILSDDMMEQLRQQMGAAGEELAGYLQDSLARSLEGAGTEYESAKQLFIDSITMIGTGAQEEWEETLSDLNVPEERIALLAEQVGDLFSVIEMPDATAKDIREAFKANGIWITNGLAESFVGKGKEDVARAMQLLGMGVDEDTIRMLDLTNLNANLTAYMNESGKDITTIAKELGSDVGDGLGFTIPEAIAKALGIGTEEVKRVKGEMVEEATASTEEIAEAESQSSELGEKSAGAVATAEEEKIGDVKESTGKVTSAVTEKYEALPDEVKPYAEKLMEYIVTALSDKDGTVKAAIEAVAQAAVDRAREILASDVGIEIAKNFLSGIESGVVENGGAVKERFGTLADQIVAYMRLGASYTDGYNTTYYVMQGLVSGLKENNDAVVSWAETVARNIVKEFRDEMGIHSPSKVFQELGNYTMMGLQNGLEKQEGTVLNTISNIANSVIDEAQNAGAVDMTVHAMSDGLDVVAGKMERISFIFEGIAQTIADMGGLEIPTVASGKVLPYRTKVGDINSTSTGIDTNSLESALYSAITRAMGAPGNQEQEINITLSIDGRKLSDIVTRYQRQQDRAWGR